MTAPNHARRFNFNLRHSFVLTLVFATALLALPACARSGQPDLGGVALTPSVPGPSRALPSPAATVTPTAPQFISSGSTPARETAGPSETSTLPVATATASIPPSPLPTASPTSTATATPLSGSLALPRGWPENYPDLSHSKLSLHVSPNRDAYIMDFVRRVHPRLIKAVGDTGWLAQVKQVSPGTVIVGRLSKFDKGWLATKDPVTAARDYIAINIESYRLNPFVDFWEGPNEFNSASTDEWKWFAQFEAARACLMQAQGLRAAVGGFSPGTPEFDKMALFLPALEAAYRCGGIFTLHEGVSPIPGCGVAVNNPDFVLPGAPTFPNIPMGYMTTRYRYWYEGYLKPLGLGDLPLVVSELEPAPIVEDSPCNVPGAPEWKKMTDWWVQHGIGATGVEAYVKVLAWYDQLIRADSYVIGATIFTAGSVDPNDMWFTHDLHDVILPLADYELGLK